jgi:hypothetical protein
MKLDRLRPMRQTLALRALDAFAHPPYRRLTGRGEVPSRPKRTVGTELRETRTSQAQPCKYRRHQPANAPQAGSSVGKNDPGPPQNRGGDPATKQAYA